MRRIFLISFILLNVLKVNASLIRDLNKLYYQLVELKDNLSGQKTLTDDWMVGTSKKPVIKSPAFEGESGIVAHFNVPTNLEQFNEFIDKWKKLEEELQTKIRHQKYNFDFEIVNSVLSKVQNIPIYLKRIENEQNIEKLKQRIDALSKLIKELEVAGIDLRKNLKNSSTQVNNLFKEYILVNDEAIKNYYRPYYENRKATMTQKDMLAEYNRIYNIFNVEP